MFSILIYFPDTMVRQAGMVVKSILLMYYKNSRGRNYRKQVTYAEILMVCKDNHFNCFNILKFEKETALLFYRKVSPFLYSDLLI